MLPLSSDYICGRKFPGFQSEVSIYSKWSFTNYVKLFSLFFDHPPTYGYVFAMILLNTVPVPIKDAASIQKLLFEPMHYDTFYPKSFTFF